MTNYRWTICAMLFFATTVNYLAEVDEIQAYVTNERSSMKEEDQPFMTVSLKIDQDTKMGIVTDIKQALRQAYALKINYSARARE